MTPLRQVLILLPCLMMKNDKINEISNSFWIISSTYTHSLYSHQSSLAMTNAGRMTTTKRRRQNNFFIFKMVFYECYSYYDVRVRMENMWSQPSMVRVHKCCRMQRGFLLEHESGHKHLYCAKVVSFAFSYIHVLLTMLDLVITLDTFFNILPRCELSIIQKGSKFILLEAAAVNIALVSLYLSPVITD